LKNKILIVGATGFLGHNFAKKCLKKNFRVTCLSRNKPNKKRYLKSVKYIFADISKKKQLSIKLNQNYDYIINFAGDVDHHGKNTFSSHFNGCKNLVNIFKKKKISKFIQIGSSVEYGKLTSPHSEKKSKVKINELQSVYAKAKLSASNYLLNLFYKEKFPVTIFRPYLVYGPGQDENRLVPYVIKSCIENKNFPCSNGQQYRDFIYIDDVINIIFKSLKNTKVVGEIFNLCSGKPIKVRKIINFIKDELKKGNPKFGEIPFRKDEVIRFYGNPKKTLKHIQLKSKTPILRGLKKTIKYYKVTK
jgi:UDP-glucose 4-epimerase